MKKNNVKSVQFDDQTKLEILARAIKAATIEKQLLNIFTAIVGDDAAKTAIDELRKLTFFIPNGKNSKNQKTGNIGQFYGCKLTCPVDCYFKRIGACYARSGHCAHWFDVASGKLVKVAKKDEYKKLDRSVNELIETVAARGDGNGALYRVNVSGDICMTGTNNINVAYLAKLAAAFLGSNYKPYTYTHAALNENNIAILKEVNKVMTINKSCETIEAAEKAYRAGVPAVLAVEKIAAKQVTINGIKYQHCPAQCNGKTCATCKLCACKDRKCVIVFEGHGPAAVVNRIRKSGELIKNLGE